MKAQSNQRPQDIIECSEKSIINYNIVEKEIEDENGIRTIFEYEYVILYGKPTKTKFIEALEETDKIQIIPNDVFIEYKNNIGSK